jgi:hypothetical protein
MTCTKMKRGNTIKRAAEAFKNFGTKDTTHKQPVRIWWFEKPEKGRPENNREERKP